jgi:predicted dehydrogenase
MSSGPNSAGGTRRTFLKTTSAALIGSSLLEGSLAAQTAPARGDDTLRVALVGCGGRGTGAANQALSTEGSVKLVAMADAFEDRLASSLEQLSELHPDKVDVPESRRFVGFDAYRQAMEQDVDVVVLATPPGFRPIHFEHAVALQRHVFMEKPVAVDGPGIRKVLAAAEVSKRNGLKVGVGLQRHHDAAYQETVRRIHDGAIGDVQLMRCYWNGSGVWVRPRKPGMTEMEYQMRNWYYFNWLCGDHIVEQHIHNLDVCNWIKGDHPVKAQGQGGRQVRSGIDHGEIFDHHMVEYTYADGTTMLSQCRHIPNTWSSVSEHAVGTRGSANMSAKSIESVGGWTWRYREDRKDAYQVEHDRLFAAIREDTPHNEAETGAVATMTAILGRMATYSGNLVTWDDALASGLDLSPARYAWDAPPPTLPDETGAYAIPMPGSTRAV